MVAAVNSPIMRAGAGRCGEPYDHFHLSANNFTTLRRPTQGSEFGQIWVRIEKRMSKNPAKPSAVEGAAIRMQYMTAYGALVPVAHLAKGDFVCDNGRVEQCRYCGDRDCGRRMDGYNRRLRRYFLLH